MGNYTGTFPDIKMHYTHDDVVADMNAWATKIANDNSFKYKIWRSSDPKTRECPICKGYPKDPKTNDPAKAILGHHGWNCIGFAFAVWHHGGRLGTWCNCHVIANDTAQKIIAAKTDAEALKIAKKFIKTNDLVVIRGKNGKNIPQSQWKAGDIMCQFKGNKYTHTYYYRGNGKITDSTGSGGKTAVDRQIATRNYTNYTARIIFRYTGNGTQYRNYIKHGDTGSQVKKLQRFLNWAVSAGLVVDGEFGDKTRVAVKAFQKKCKITPDGIFGEDSLKAAKNFDKIDPIASDPLDFIAAPASVEKKPYSGIFPTLVLKKNNAQVIDDAVRWARWISGDNDFHYGYTDKHGSTDSTKWNPNAHHNGCYFCGTNTTKGGRSKKGINEYDHTYCCNAFVHAAWAHGGCIPTALQLCAKGSSWGFSVNEGYNKSSLFKKLGHPSKSKLKKGDVLCSNTHVALYIGNGKIVQASGGDDNVKGSSRWKKSISICTLTDSDYKKFVRVYRYKSSVDTTMVISHGEVSSRVKDLQRYLNWYFEREVLVVDGLFGDTTYKYVRVFQLAQKIAADGIVGADTIAKMKMVKK